MTREFRDIKKGEASPLATFQTNIVSQRIAKPSFLKICVPSPVFLPPNPSLPSHPAPCYPISILISCETRCSLLPQGSRCCPILRMHFPFSCLGTGTHNAHSYLQVSSLFVFPCYSKDCWCWIKFEAHFAHMCVTRCLASHCLLAAKWPGKEKCSLYLAVSDGSFTPLLIFTISRSLRLLTD